MKCLAVHKICSATNRLESCLSVITGLQSRQGPRAVLSRQDRTYLNDPRLRTPNLWAMGGPDRSLSEFNSTILNPRYPHGIVYPHISGYNYLARCDAPHPGGASRYRVIRPSSIRSRISLIEESTVLNLEQAVSGRGEEIAACIPDLLKACSPDPPQESSDEFIAIVLPLPLWARWMGRMADSVAPSCHP